VSRVPRPAIVFIGFMGAGKSTALAAAREAGLETTEIDQLMERQFDCSVPEAFERHGEEGFRARESEVVGELLERADGGAIALGGGSVLLERVRDALGRHVVVWLQIDAAEAWRRIEGSERPLARNADDVARLLAERQPLYEELADATIPQGDPGQVVRALPSIQALAGLPAGTKLLWAASASGEYPVLAGTGLLDGLRETEWWPLDGRRFCVSDTSVGPLYADRLPSMVEQIEIEPGEGSKSIETMEWVLEQLAAEGMTREDHLVALGGGVVGDLAGFCAHIYQRGVPVVHVPTSLVAQVDSAYGGKTGVDAAGGKNYVGAYHLPKGVLVDTSTLASLPPRELAAGFVEVIKTGLLAGGDLWERVRSIESLDPTGLDELVFACARFKCDVVAADERDSGFREILNLGHTVGHAIETESARRLGFGHGESVGLGLLAALRLSDASELRDEVEAILIRHGLPVELEAGDTATILALIEQDKKRTGAGVGFVLLSEPGKPRTGQILEPDAVREAVLELYA
jgi:shikimate kinase / 3-dehydroquinate synthase